MALKKIDSVKTIFFCQQTHFCVEKSILRMVAHLEVWAFSVQFFCRAVFSDIMLGRMSLPPFLHFFCLLLLLCSWLGLASRPPRSRLIIMTVVRRFLLCPWRILSLEACSLSLAKPCGSLRLRFMISLLVRLYVIVWAASTSQKSKVPMR